MVKDQIECGLQTRRSWQCFCRTSNSSTNALINLTRSHIGPYLETSLTTSITILPIYCHLNLNQTQCMQHTKLIIKKIIKRQPNKTNFSFLFYSSFQFSIFNFQFNPSYLNLITTIFNIKKKWKTSSENVQHRRRFISPEDTHSDSTTGASCDWSGKPTATNRRHSRDIEAVEEGRLDKERIVGIERDRFAFLSHLFHCNG